LARGPALYRFDHRSFLRDRVTPFVLGLPLLLAWIVAWVVLTSIIMAVIYRFDPAVHDDEPEASRREVSQ
jgi:hypothetical protein